MTGITDFNVLLDLLQTSETYEQQRMKIWEHVDLLR